MSGDVGLAKALQGSAGDEATVVLSMTEVVVPGAVGIALLGDRVRPGWEAVSLLGVVAALASVVAVTRLAPDSVRGRAH